MRNFIFCDPFFVGKLRRAGNVQFKVITLISSLSHFRQTLTLNFHHTNHWRKKKTFLTMNDSKEDPVVNDEVKVTKEEEEIEVEVEMEKDKRQDSIDDSVADAEDVPFEDPAIISTNSRPPPQMNTTNIPDIVTSLVEDMVEEAEKGKEGNEDQEGRKSYTSDALHKIKEDSSICKRWPKYLDQSFKNPRGKWDPDRWHQNRKRGSTPPPLPQTEKDRPNSSQSTDAKVSVESRWSCA